MYTFAADQELCHIGVKAPSERLNQKYSFQIKYLNFFVLLIMSL